LLVDRGVAARIPGFDLFWNDFSTWVRLRHASGPDRQTLLSDVTAVFQHDIPAWLAQADLSTPQSHRLPCPTEWRLSLSAEGRRELDAALEMWSLHIKGLTKLVTRIKVDWQVRDCERVQPQVAVAA
jgi:hypothetical protein